jgi:hypothetical protein
MLFKSTFVLLYDLDLDIQVVLVLDDGAES